MSKRARLTGPVLFSASRGIAHDRCNSASAWPHRAPFRWRDRVAPIASRTMHIARRTTASAIARAHHDGVARHLHRTTCRAPSTSHDGVARHPHRTTRRAPFTSHDGVARHSHRTRLAARGRGTSRPRDRGTVVAPRASLTQHTTCALAHSVADTRSPGLLRASCAGVIATSFRDLVAIQSQFRP